MSEPFGTRLRAARDARRLSEAETCVRLGISGTEHYAQWERDETRPNRIVYLRMLQLFPELEALDPDWARGWVPGLSVAPAPPRPSAPPLVFSKSPPSPGRSRLRHDASATAPAPWLAVVQKSVEIERGGGFDEPLAETPSLENSEEADEETGEAAGEEVPKTPLKRGGPCRPVETHRTVPIQVRVTEAEKSLLSAAVESMGLTLSGWLRMLALRALKERAAERLRNTADRTCGLGDKLTATEMDSLRRDRCPDCGENGFVDGPGGGLSQNFRCAAARCGSRFHTMGPFGAERASDASPDAPSIDQRDCAKG